MTLELDLRADAMACLKAAIAAVEPESLTMDFLRQHPECIVNPGRLVIVAIGKAAATMTRGAVHGIRDLRSTHDLTGALIAPTDDVDSLEQWLSAKGLPTSQGLEVFGGGHPMPNLEGVRGARAIHTLAGELEVSDTLLCLISGGGSALMTLPPDAVTLTEMQSTTQTLLQAGANIHQLNSVRKHLDLLKGGRLAQVASPARVVALVLSDVVGDPLDVIASGPVTADRTTYRDAIDTLRQFAVWDIIPAAVRDHLERGNDGNTPESPKPGAACFDRVETHVIGSNRLAADAARATAERRGYATQLLTTCLTGEAREVGHMLASIGQQIVTREEPLSAPACIVAAGETTVSVRGGGVGGRNQEVALGAALALDENPVSESILITSMGTDGIDGPTDAAGAWSTGTTLPRARQLGLDAARALADNDAYPFFRALDDLIITGATGTNVMDIALVLVGTKT